MVNWDEAGKTWPQPQSHAARLLRGLLWGQHYRHSNPQCEGDMPGSFELREDTGEDRLRAVEEWLRAEGYAYRFRRKRWRVWTHPDRPGKGLRPEGIEQDEKPNRYPSGAPINVSMWDMIEKEFPELRNARTLQGSSSSSASPGKEKRSAGDRKRDRKWREYQESLAAEAAQGARGGTPAQSPQRASGGHHQGHNTLGDFLQVAKHAKAKPRQLHLRKSGPSSDVESAHRGRMPADQASSSSSVAPDQRDVARACERACGVPCNLRVPRQRATQQNAAIEGAVGIAQQEAAEWEHGMAIQASTVAAIAAGLTARAAHEAATAQVKGEVAAAAEEARLTQEAIACKEAEVKVLKRRLPKRGQRRRRRKGPTPKQRPRPRRTPPGRTPSRPREGRSLRRGPRRRRIWGRWSRRRLGCSRPGTPRRLVPGRRPKGELPQPRPPQWRRRRPSSAARLPREDPELRPFGSFSKGTLPPRWHWIRRRWTRAAVGAVAPLPTDGERVRGRPPRGHGGQRADTPTTVTPSSPPATGMNEAANIAEEWLAEEAETSPWSQKVRIRISLLPTGAQSLPRLGRLGGATWTRMMTWTSTTRRSPHPRTPEVTRRRPTGTPWRRTIRTPWRTPTKWTPWRRTTGRGRTPWTDGTRQRPSWGPPGDPDDPPGNGDPDSTWRWIVYLRRRVQSLEREVDGGKGEMPRIARVAARAQKELDIAKIEMVKSAKVATATQKQLDIAKGETRQLNRVISGLQQRLDVLEGRGSVGSDHPPLESGSSDDGWGPGPGPGRPHTPGGAPRSRPSASAPSLSAPSHHSAGRRNERVPPGSGSEDWRDEWLSAEYHNRRAPRRTPVRPQRPAPAPEPIPMAGGRYGGLRDEVPRGDVEWDAGGGEDLDLDLEELDISPPRGVRREAAERSRRRRNEEAYMEGVRREHLGSAYMEGPRRGHADTGEEMEVAAVGVRGRGRWEPRSTSRPAFMVSKAADAAVPEDLKDINPPMYDGNPLNLDRFLEKLDDWGVTVTKDMDPADAEKYVFRRFRYRLPEVLQDLYFVATKEGKIKTLKEA